MELIIRACAFIMGLSGQVAQITLVREFLIVFSGNEFLLGIILSNWLLLEAIGAFLSYRTIKRRKKITGYLMANIFFCFTLCIALLAIRLLKRILKISVSEHLGIGASFISSLSILSFVSGFHGALFPYTCHIYNIFLPQKGVQAGKIYALETLGTVIGGIILTYIFIPFADSFRTVFTVSFINISLCALLSFKTDKNKTTFLLCLAISCFFGFLIFCANQVHWWSIKKQWPGQNVVHYENSKYGNICVVENEGQYIFFQQGIPEIFIPYPDMVTIEEFVHLALLAHEAPKNILLIGSGGGGVINEIIKHPSVERVQYVELDPLIIKLFKKFITPLTEKEFSSPKLRVIYKDGRLYLKEAQYFYDIILIGIQSPLTLESNRLFTKEFFHLARTRLNQNGMLVIGIPFSFRYTSKELKNMTRTIYLTLESVFKYVRAFPGDGSCLFLCSDSDSILRLSKTLVAERVRERKLIFTTELPWYIEQKLHEGWKTWFESFVEKKIGHINSDFKPIAVFYTVAYVQSLISPFVGHILEGLSRIGLEIVVLTLISLVLAYFVLKKRQSEKKDARSIGIPILCTGFCGMVIGLIILFSFQSIFGYVFSWLGVLLSAYMGGSAFGAYIASLKRLDSTSCLRFFLYSEVSLVLFSLFCPVFIWVTNSYGPSFLLRVHFLFLSVIAGFLVGIQFPLANFIYLGDEMDPEKVAAFLYASDLGGGFIAGLVTGFWLIPVFGVMQTSYILALIKLASLTIFMVEFFIKPKSNEK